MSAQPQGRAGGMVVGVWFVYSGGNRRGRLCREVVHVGWLMEAPLHLHLRDALREAERHVVHLRGHRFARRTRFPTLNRLSQRRLGLQRRLGWRRGLDWRFRLASWVCSRS